MKAPQINTVLTATAATAASFQSLLPLPRSSPSLQSLVLLVPIQSRLGVHVAYVCMQTWWRTPQDAVLANGALPPNFDGNSDLDELLSN